MSSQWIFTFIAVLGAVVVVVLALMPDSDDDDGCVWCGAVCTEGYECGACLGEEEQ